MRVIFNTDWTYRPSEERRVSLRYRGGFEYTVKREAGEAAVALGVAEEVGGHSRPDPDSSGKSGKAAKAATEVPRESAKEMKQILAAEEGEG